MATILSKHPEIGFCKVKEPEFFLLDSISQSDIAAYHQLFPTKGIRMEASTNYSVHLNKVEVWKNMFDYNPELKILYMVRKPVERFISQYVHWYERGYTDLPIDRALENEYIKESGKYKSQIEPFLRFFGENQVKIINFHSFLSEKGAIMNGIAEFLNISKFNSSLYADVHENAGYQSERSPAFLDKLKASMSWTKRILPSKLVSATWKTVATKKRSISQRPNLSLDLTQKVTHFYRDEILGLSELMDEDLSHWLDES